MNLRLLCFLIVSALASKMAFAQGEIQFVPNEITGTLSFNNVNPAVLNLLNAPGNEGMSNLFVQANSGRHQPLLCAGGSSAPLLPHAGVRVSC